MPELYQILGVRSGAADEEIRTAFRGLAKRLHPDLNPGAANAERRLRDIIRAYETLSDPASRTVYDTGLARGRSLRRSRFRAKATTTLTVFLLTVTVGLFWRDLSDALRLASAYPARVAGDIEAAAIPPQAAPRQAAGDSGDAGVDERPKVDAKPSSAMATADARATADELVANDLPPPKMPTDATAPQAQAKVDLTSESYTLGLDDPLRMASSDDTSPSLPGKHPDAEVKTDKGGDHPAQASAPANLPSSVPSKPDHWASYEDDRFGFTLEYPEDVFAPDPAQVDGGKSFLSRDGRARLLISAALTKGVPLAAHRRSLMEGPYGDATFDYTPHRRTWFVLSGTLRAEMFYQRVTFSCGGRALHAWKLVYPLSEREYYDRIVEEVHRRYRHGKGPGGDCG